MVNNRVLLSILIVPGFYYLSFMLNQNIAYNMNKGELISAIADKSGLTKAASEKALNAMIKAVSTSLKKGKRVGLVGFGSFSVSQRAARIGRNPQTGKEIKIPAKKVVKFKPGSDLSL
jgi:DNA-binding protein HU-beta